MEHHGLVRFSVGLEAEWRFPYGAGHGVIDDCYALNLDGEMATAYYYSDFNIAQVRGSAVSSWSGSPAGAHGLMVDGDSVVLIGGYGDNRDRTAAVWLSPEGVQIESTGRHNGLPGRQASQWVCRGPEVHVFVGLAWYRASLGA